MTLIKLSFIFFQYFSFSVLFPFCKIQYYLLYVILKIKIFKCFSFQKQKSTKCIFNVEVLKNSYLAFSHQVGKQKLYLGFTKSGKARTGKKRNKRTKFLWRPINYKDILSIKKSKENWYKLWNSNFFYTWKIHQINEQEWSLKLYLRIYILLAFIVLDLFNENTFKQSAYIIMPLENLCGSRCKDLSKNF